MADVLKSAVVASQWWAKKIRDTANLSNYDMGNRSFAGNDLIALIGALSATSLTPTPEAAETFQIALQSIIMRELENNPEHKVTLKSDYRPDELLSEAAKAAGIDPSVFPYKRTMMVDMDRVLVSDGCGEPLSEVRTA